MYATEKSRSSFLRNQLKCLNILILDVQKVCQKYHWLSFLLQISLILPNNDLHAFFQIIRQKLTLDKACHPNKHFLLKWLSKGIYS